MIPPPRSDTGPTIDDAVRVCADVSDSSGRNNRGELLLAVARAICELAAQVRTDSFRLPYPRAVQITLDRVVLDCLRRGAAPPRSLPDLIERFREGRIRELPIVIPADLADAAAPLVSALTSAPTRTCAELASAGPDGTVEQEAEAALHESTDGRPDFDATRDFLISHVVMPPKAVRQFSGSRRSEIWRRVNGLYREAPAAYLTRAMGERFLMGCPTCGFPALPAGQEQWVCESGQCGLTEQPVEHPARGTLLLPMPLRLFLSLPGRTEQEVRRRFTAAGITTTAVPGGLGACQVAHPVLGPVLFQVFDREHPALLAAYLSSLASAGQGRVAVIPARVIARQPDHLTRIRELLPPPVARTVLSETEFLEPIISASPRQQESSAHA